MLNAVVRRLSRWMPRAEADGVSPDDEWADWADSDSNCHNSSYELATGLDVIEHFADTLPAFHAFPIGLQGLR